MKIYTAWVEAGEVFDPTTHSKEDLIVLALNISQKEGEITLANLKVANYLFDFKKSHLIISYQQKVIFRGVLLGTPRKQDQYKMELEFAAFLPKTLDKLQELVKQLQKSERWHSLFFDENSQTLFRDVLESGQDLFYFNSSNGEVSLSNIFKGNKTITLLTQNIVADTFKAKIANFPLRSVSVQLKSEWLQSGEGEFDLFPMMSRNFPRGIVNTLTPHHLQQHWSKVGEFLGQGRRRTGYQVVESKLSVFKPPFTGELNLYPKVSPNFWHFDGQSKVQRRFERYWFRGKLVIGW